MTEKYKNVEFQMERAHRFKVVVQLPEELAEEMSNGQKDVGAKKLKAVLASIYDLDSKQPIKPLRIEYKAVDINLYPDSKLPAKFILSRERIEGNLAKLEQEKTNE